MGFVHWDRVCCKPDILTQGHMNSNQVRGTSGQETSQSVEICGAVAEDLVDFSELLASLFKKDQHFRVVEATKGQLIQILRPWPHPPWHQRLCHHLNQMIFHAKLPWHNRVQLIDGPWTLEPKDPVPNCKRPTCYWTCFTTITYIIYIYIVGYTCDFFPRSMMMTVTRGSKLKI